MKPLSTACSLLVATVLMTWLVAVPLASGQHGGSHGSGGGRPGGGGHASGSRPAGPSSGGGTTSGGQATSTPRAVPKTAGTSAPNNPGGATGNTATDPTASNSRPGTVVGRTAPRQGAAGTTVVIPNGYYGGFYPWGYAGLGFGGYYGGYYDYYDPWTYDGYTPPSYGYGYDGWLKLKVKPKDASVYVDGNYAGRVDDFDGVFQRLRIERGPHHIEIQADGFEPLELDVQIQSNRTTTYSGELKRIQ